MRIPVPTIFPGGQPGEATVSLISQRQRDVKGLYNAIGIAYRAPSIPEVFPLSLPPRPPRPDDPTAPFLTPSATPNSERTMSQSLGAAAGHRSATNLFTSSTLLASPTTPTPPPLSPSELRSAASAGTLTCTATQSLSSPSTFCISRLLSVLFSLHGISPTDLHPWAASHLISEAALPLTALLHCMNAVSTPWWLGGNLSTGLPGGAAIAASPGARAWVSAHDDGKPFKNFATGKQHTNWWKRDEAKDWVEKLAREGGDNVPAIKRAGDGRTLGTVATILRAETEVFRLGPVEEVLVTSPRVSYAKSRR